MPPDWPLSCSIVHDIDPVTLHRATCSTSIKRLIHTSATMPPSTSRLGDKADPHKASSTPASFTTPHRPSTVPLPTTQNHTSMFGQ
ncbi:hypothetical protein Micbo1qcDRAFT_168928 [Microdochium bolleyi]|uniref:Uncharacterized protein n=1 Tax=Microdochium bolleyi TaxID=196109 RepID=A0A136ILW6_9PEZI|nr:hypothetical protein Micbo1qcDRAFT_168928 [Microdochium bolleyi]